jgi:hypothetical protein
MAGVDLPEPTRLGEVLWLEPYPDHLLEGLADSAPGPDARYEAKEAISLAFVTALPGAQHLGDEERVAACRPVELVHVGGAPPRPGGPGS